MRSLTLATAFLAAFASMQAVSAETLTVVEKVVNESTVDLGANGDSQGDLLAFGNPIYDSNGSERIGSDEGFCVRTTVGMRWECTWTVALKEGRIAVTGTFNDSGDSVLAIVGGTDKYQGARGTMFLHPRSDGKSYEFKYRLQ